MCFSFLVLALPFQLKAAESARSPFVLVHGALFTSAGWAPVQRILQNDGYNVVTLDVPGRAGDPTSPKDIDLTLAAKRVCQVVNLQSEPVILVGHSQGGALITQATEFCGDRIRALVYVAAVLPLSGETAFQALNPERDTGFGKCAEFDPTARLFRLKKDGPIAELFFQDLSGELAERTLATMVSEPAGIGTTVATYDQDRFDATPKYYIEALQDRILTPETQREIQQRVKLTMSFSMDTGHCPFLSRPEEFAGYLKHIENRENPGL